MPAHIVDAYETQQTPLLEQLLTAKSLADVLADVDYYLTIGDQDAQLVTQIQQDQQSLGALQLSTQATRAQTQQLRLTTFQAEQEMTTQRNALLTAQNEAERSRSSDTSGAGGTARHVH